MTDAPSAPMAFLGLDFIPLDRPAALAAVLAKSEARAPFVYVATPNVAHIVALHKDVAARRGLYEDAWLVLNDSRILEMLARWSGLALPVAAGSDLSQDLAEAGLCKQEPITIVGGTAQLVADLAQKYGWSDIRWHSPPMGLATNPAALEAAAAFVAAQNARVSFLCVGSPQQEMLARAIMRRGDATGVGLCVGASMEFLAGHVARAPLWMQRARLEWLHRLASEPGRLWRRYLVEGPEVFRIWQRWHQERARAASRASMASRNAR